MSTVAAGSPDVVITSGAGLTVIDIAVIADPDALSVTFTLKLLVPAAVGVPDIVAPLKLNPAGSDPLAIAHVYGVTPPEAVNVAE